MSIRIQNDGIAGSAASQIGQTDALGGSANARRGPSGAGGTDRVEISSLSEGLSAAAADLSARQADKVGRLAALYAQGAYQTDPQQISRSLIAHALGGAAMGDGE